MQVSPYSEHRLPRPDATPLITSASRDPGRGGGVGLPSPDGGLIVVDTGETVFFPLHLKMFRWPHLVEKSRGAEFLGMKSCWCPRVALVLSQLH